MSLMRSSATQLSRPMCQSLASMNGRHGPGISIAGTERIYLRRLREEDVSEAYLGWMNDPEVTRYLEARFCWNDMEGLRRYVSLTPPHGIFLKDDTHIGNIKLDIDEHHCRADIGLLIGPEYWGNSYATEAINAAANWAFRMRLHKVTAGAYAGNVGSIRAFEKAGFMHEAVLKDHWLVDGEYQDGILMAKLADAEQGPERLAA